MASFWQSRTPRLQAELEAGRQQIRDGRGIWHEEFWGEVEAAPKPKPPRRKKA
jgi:hypothetical protein